MGPLVTKRGQLDLAPATEAAPGPGTLAIPSDAPRTTETVEIATEVRTSGVVSTSTVEPPPPGAALQERFTFGRLLGRGGMGEVQQAVDRGLRRSVAVKTLRQADVPSELRPRFLAEARITAQLEHPNILPLYSLERAADGGMAFVMRLVEGGTLAEFMGKVCKSHESGYVKPQHRLEARLEHFLKVCEAIDYAHSRGVVHRDIKPENIMIAAHGQVYVMDWGLALVMGERKGDAAPATAPVSLEVTGQTGRLTSFGDVLGTPEYMAPEQARGEVEALGPAADQYALGLVLFELIALRPARESLPGKGTVMAAMKGELTPLQHRYDEPIPVALAKIVQRATAPQPEDRYPSLRRFADDLRRYRRGEAPEVAPDAWPAALWRRLNRRPAVAASLFLGLIALALAAVTVGLYSTLDERQTAADEARVTARLTGAVVQRSNDFERRLDDVRLALEGFGRAAEQLLLHGQADPAPNWIAAGSIGEVPGTTRSDRYGERVNLEHGVYVLAPGTSRAEVEESLARLAPLRATMKGIYRRDGAARLPLLSVYAGFESGLLISYPGNDGYPPDFDPRRRPWYRSGKALLGHNWGRPYRDKSGGTLQLPATLALFDQTEALMGLVAIDVDLADLADKLRMPELPGWQRSYLVDDEARVIVDTSAPQGPAAADDDTLQLERFPAPEVVAAIGDRRPLGTVRRGDGRLVFTRLDVIPWYVVVALDEQAFVASLGPPGR
jgi:eukaryotic-like serine/threonine-protein kinase